VNYTKWIYLIIWRGLALKKQLMAKNLFKDW